MLEHCAPVSLFWMIFFDEFCPSVCVCRFSVKLSSTESLPEPELSSPVLVCASLGLLGCPFSDKMGWNWSFICIFSPLVFVLLEPSSTLISPLDLSNSSYPGLPCILASPNSHLRLELGCRASSLSLILTLWLGLKLPSMSSPNSPLGLLLDVLMGRLVFEDVL